MGTTSQISQAGFQISKCITLFDSLAQSDLGYKELRLTGWEILKKRIPIGPLNFPKIMREVELEFLNNGRSLVDNVNELFERLTAKLAPQFEVAQFPKAAQQATELQLRALQERLREHEENAALETIWNRRLRPLFEQQGAFQNVALPQGIEGIRRWLNDPANQQGIQQVTALDFQGFNLKALPAEIGLFTGLQSLDLSFNQLSSLPESIGDLHALTRLYLRDNQLRSLPESFGNLHTLTRLFLENNQLSSLPESFGSLQALTRLSLHNNQISSLPESFGSLQALTWLSLHNNQISSLPESFGNLRALTELYLGYNQLSSLPESLGNLRALTELNLSCNQLSSLPESIGNLRALTRLSLQSNQLSSLPKSVGDLQVLTELNLSFNQLNYLQDSIGNLLALTRLYLHFNQLCFLPESFGNLRNLGWVVLNDNPWMLASDKEPYKIADYRTFLARLEPLKKYAPQSPLATLFHAIIFNKSAEAIQQAYAQLCPEMQQRIAALIGQDLNISEPAPSSSAASSSSDPALSQDSLFFDMGLFARSVRKATYALYESLKPEHKKSVHLHIWDLAGRPETDDPQWGERHAFDHVLRFTDALERATQN